MNVDSALKASTQLAEGSQPGMRALDHPAMVPKPVVALDATASNACRDAQLAQVSAAAREVVALVRMQFAWPAARPAALSSHVWQGIYQLLEHHRVMAVDR